MTAGAAVWVHIGDNMKCRCIAQPNRDCIVRNKQIERTLHPPFRHRLARMLPCIKPDLLGAFSDRQEVEGAALKRCAQNLVADVRNRCDAIDQRSVALHRIRREIGDPKPVGVRCMPNRHDAIGIVGLRADPYVVVDTDAGTVIGPAQRIGRRATIGDSQGQRLARSTIDAKVKPLIEMRILVRPDRKVEPGSVRADYFDVAAVKIAVDTDAHGTLIVRPDSPGKSLNNAAASLSAASPGCPAAELDGPSVSARPSHTTP